MLHVANLYNSLFQTLGFFFSLSSSLTLAFMREEWVVFFSVTHLSKTHRFPSVVWSRLLPAEPLKGATCIYNSVSRGRMEQSSVRCTDGPRLTQTMGGGGGQTVWTAASNFRQHCLMWVEINTLPLWGVKGWG